MDDQACAMLDDVRELLVWGSGDPPPEGHACVYTWNGYIEQRGVKSLLRYCESHAEELRSSYLAWIQDIGEIRIGQRTVVEHLAIEDGLSYWWMTLLVEKSPYKSSITDAIRLLALERIVREYKPAVLHLVGQSREICMAVQALCRSLKIGCRITAHPQPASRVVTTKKILRLLPQSIQGMLSFGRYLWSHRAFRKLRMERRRRVFVSLLIFLQYAAGARKTRRFLFGLLGWSPPTHSRV